MVERLSCPAWGAPLSVTGDLGDAVCDYCGSTLRLSRNSSGIIGVEIIKGLEKVRVGTDRTASELAMSRIRLELESLVAQRNALAARPVLPRVAIGFFACMLVYLFSAFQSDEADPWSVVFYLGPGQHEASGSRTGLTHDPARPGCAVNWAFPSNSCTGRSTRGSTLGGRYL